MASAKYYSPRLDRDLVTQLYHTGKSRRVPMTRLASALLREALSKLGTSGDDESAIVCEEPPATDPGGRKS